MDINSMRGGVLLEDKENAMTKRKKLTFREVAQRWEARPTRFGNEQSETRVAIVKRLVKRYGDTRLSDVFWEDEIDLLKSELRRTGDRFALRTKPLVESSINNYLGVLSMLFNLATGTMGYPNALPKIEKLAEARRQTALRPEEITEFCDELDPYRRSLFKMAFHTGLRNTNVRELLWSQCIVDWDAGEAYLRFRKEDMKSGKEHEIPVNKYAFGIIENQKMICNEMERKHGVEIPWVFPFFNHSRKWNRENPESRFRPMGRQSVTRTFAKIREKLSLPDDVVFHTSRHSFATHHVRNSTHQSELMKLGNWSNMKSLERYVHVDHKRKREVLENVQVKV